MTTPALWALRALWLLLPFTAGDAVVAAAQARSGPVTATLTTLAWLAWGLVAVSAAVPLPTTLVALRVLVPASAAGVAWAVTNGDGVGPLAASGLLVAGLSVVLAFLPQVGEAFVDGSSYGPERRLPLRTPGALLLGPVEVAGVAAVAGLAAGPLLLAARQWVAGALAVAVGVPVALAALRSLHGLARRFVVFVPGGMVLHDHMAVVDPVLFSRHNVAAIRPAPAGTDGIDLTLGSAGLALEVEVSEALSLTPTRPGADTLDLVSTHRVVFTPSRPGHLLDEARARRLRTEA